MNPFIYYTMCRRAKILFYCKLPRIGIYSIRLTPRIMSEPFRIWLTHVRNNLFTGIGKTLHCIPDSAYRHSVELHRMVRNGYSVSIRWVVKTVQCSLPMWDHSHNGTPRRSRRTTNREHYEGSLYSWSFALLRTLWWAWSLLARVRTTFPDSAGHIQYGWQEGVLRPVLVQRKACSHMERAILQESWRTKFDCNRLGHV